MKMVVVPVVHTPLTSTSRTSSTTRVMTCSSRLSSVCRLAFPVKPIEADPAKMVAEEEAVKEEAVKEEVIKKEGADSSAH
jgi:hypothetical protein